jgi:competence ComEA-like helix-hairpin-helix protein
MFAMTPAERRGALLVALLLSLGAARDLWRAAHPRMTPSPPAAGSTATGPVDPAAAAGALPTLVAGAAVATVDLNRAGAAELDALPGIGPVLAGRILRHRSEHGPFREVEDLLAVPGIGPRLYERLRPHIRAGSPADSAGPSPAARPGVPPTP